MYTIFFNSSEKQYWLCSYITPLARDVQKIIGSRHVLRNTQRKCIIWKWTFSPRTQISLLHSWSWETPCIFTFTCKTSRIEDPLPTLAVPNHPPSAPTTFIYIKTTITHVQNYIYHIRWISRSHRTHTSLMIFMLVSLQMTRVFKGFPTLLTMVRCLSCVNALVCLQITR